MTRRLIRVCIIAAALLIAALLVPDIVIEWSEDAEGITVTLLVLALAFGLVNGFLRPLARLVSIPLNVATLGLFSVVLNALLLLAVAFAVDILAGPLIVIGGFPPELSLGSIGAAAAGSFVISAISVALTILIPDA
jgi:putative membrane protein